MRRTLQIQAVLYQNEPEILKRALEGLIQAARQAASTFDIIQIFWGDASPQPIFSRDMMEKITGPNSPHIETAYCFFDQNTGYGRGNNRLAEKANTDYLLIMNPEIILSPGSLVDLVTPFADPVVGLTEARQIPVEHPKYFDPKTHETEWSSGACFMISTELFQRHQGFDAEYFFMYCEDVDLSWRIRQDGYRLYYQNLANVFHARHLSPSGSNQASITEQQYTILSEALLAYKWSYPEYARERIRLAVQRGDPGSNEAAETFQHLEQMGRLPIFHDPEHRVAKIRQFPEDGGMLFTEHRYQL